MPSCAQRLPCLCVIDEEEAGKTQDLDGAHDLAYDPNKANFVRSLWK